MISLSKAKSIIEKKFSDFDVESAFDYKDKYIFAIVPKDFNKEQDIAYIDNFYAVDKNSGEILGFAPWSEPDFLEKFS